MADKNKKTPLMYSDKEIGIIKSTFSENEFLLKAIRKLFFGQPITDEEKDTIKKTFSKPDVKEVFRKKVYGFNNFDTPIGQLSDFWLGAESQIFGATPEAIRQTIESKGTVLRMFERAFELLDNPDGEKVDITFSPETIMVDELGIQLIARNLYMKAIETSLLTVQTIAGMKDETVEETVKRLQQDSTR